MDWQLAMQGSPLTFCTGLARQSAECRGPAHGGTLASLFHQAVSTTCMTLRLILDSSNSSSDTVQEQDSTEMQRQHGIQGVSLPCLVALIKSDTAHPECQLTTRGYA